MKIDFKKLKLAPLSEQNLLSVLEWRNDLRETLRTPYFLTAEMQSQYYKDVISNRTSNTRYYKIKTELIGLLAFGGIENISWENRQGELSLMINPGYHGKGYGEAATKVYLDEGFNKLNLDYIWGECYYCSPAVNFWKKVLKKYKPIEIDLPSRKYFDGQYWDSYYFCINKDNFNKVAE